MGEVTREMEEMIQQFHQIPVLSSMAPQSIAISRRNPSVMSLDYGPTVRESIQSLPAGVGQ